MNITSILHKVFGLETKETIKTRNVFLEKHSEIANSRFDKYKAVSVYNAVDVVNRSIDLISRNFSNVDFIVQQVLSDGTLQTIPNHPIAQLLKKPNGIQGGRQYRYSAMSWRIIDGNSYQMLVTAGGNADYSKPVALFSIPSVCVALNASTNDYKYNVNIPRGKGYIQPSDSMFPIDIITGQSNLLNWNSFNTDSMLQGRSGIEPLNINSNIYDSANKWNANFFDNGCKLSTVFSVNGDVELDPDDLADLQKQIEEKFTGTGNNAKPFITGHLTPHEISSTSKDSDFILTLKKQESAICRTLGVPPILLNSGEGSTFSNQAEAKRALWEDTIIPYVNEFTEELNNQLAPRYSENIIITPDYSNVEALNQAIIDKMNSLQGISYLTINEKREKVGLDPIDGGDSLFIAANDIPLDVATSGLGIFTEDE